MHELGIIVHISKTLTEVAKENQISKIGAVTLEVGEVSGIVPHFLTDCWSYYRKKNVLIEEAELHIDTLPAVTLCEACDKTYPTIKHGKQCPFCKGYQTYLITGDECNIKEIEAC